MTDRSKKVQLGVTSTPKPSRAPATAFDPIAAALQQIHSKVTDEAIPDDFMRLLDQFDAGDAKPKGTSQ
jgi:Anti-sigma factor NepR